MTMRIKLETLCALHVTFQITIVLVIMLVVNVLLQRNLKDREK